MQQRTTLPRLLFLRRRPPPPPAAPALAQVPADADADAVGDDSPTTVGAGLEMLAPAFIQLGLGETQAIVQVLGNLLATFEAHRAELARTEAAEQQQFASIQAALSALVAQAEQTRSAKEDARADAAGRAAGARAKHDVLQQLINAEKGVATVLQRSCSASTQLRKQRGDALGRMLQQLPAPAEPPAPETAAFLAPLPAARGPIASGPPPPSAPAAAAPAAPLLLQQTAGVSFLQVAQRPGAGVKGMLDDLLSRLSQVGDTAKGKEWCTEELPRSTAALENGKKHGAALAQQVAGLETSAVSMRRVLADYDAREKMLKKIARTVAENAQAEAKVLVAEGEQHAAAQRALQAGIGALDSAATATLRPILAELEDLQELTRKAAAMLQTDAEELASAVVTARTSLSDLVNTKQRAEQEATRQTDSAKRDLDEINAQLKLAEQYAATLKQACGAQVGAAQQAHAEEVEAVKEAARIVDAATA